MIYLDLDDVLAAAEVATPGKVEVRDYGLLASAVGRPQATVFGQDAYPDIDAKAAALMHSLTTNHAFVDGNKRTALVATLLFYELNGVQLAARGEGYDLMVDVASGHLDGVEAIADRLRAWPRRT